MYQTVRAITAYKVARNLRENDAICRERDSNCSKISILKSITSIFKLNAFIMFIRGTCRFASAFLETLLLVTLYIVLDEVNTIHAHTRKYHTFLQCLIATDVRYLLLDRYTYVVLLCYDALSNITQ